MRNCATFMMLRKNAGLKNQSHLNFDASQSDLFEAAKKNPKTTEYIYL